GILTNPATCKFDPAVLRCADADALTCLTAPQVEAARKVYTPTAFYPGLAPGSELGWATYGGPRPFAIGMDYARYVLFRDPAWDFRALNAAADAARAVKIDEGITNALNPDLRPFLAHGGKLIQYHGWSDPQIPPMHSVAYYEAATKAMGGASQVLPAYRLFMAPAMGHCGGGEGPN